MNEDVNQLEQESYFLLDASGLKCPEPVMLLHNAVKKSEPGGLIKVLASDPSTLRDIPNFCEHLRHSLLIHSRDKLDVQEDGFLFFWVRKRLN